MPKEDNVAEMPKPEGQPQTVVVVPVPLEVYQEMVEALEELPRKKTKLLWNHLQNLQPQQVGVKK